MGRHRLLAVLVALAVGGIVSAVIAAERGRDDDRRPAGREATVCPGARTQFSAHEPPPACWRPYAATSPFNRVVPPRPRLLRRSNEIVRQLAEWGPPQRLLAGHADTRSDYFHPVYWARSTDPVFTIRCVRFGRCPVEGHKIRIPDAARAAGGGDGHLAVIDVRTGWEHDFWQVRQKPSGGGRLVVSFGGRTRIDGSGLGSNATAGWFGLAAGIIRASEMEAGRIDHALFAQVKCTSGRSVYPAHPGTTAALCRSIGVDGRNAPPLGSRIWLDLPPARIAALEMPAWRKTILVALNRYGMIVGDTARGSASWGLQGESGSSFTSFGERDPWSTFAAGVAPSLSSRGYSLSIDGGIDWGRHLRVLHPCVSRGRC